MRRKSHSAAVRYARLSRERRRREAGPGPVLEASEAPRSAVAPPIQRVARVATGPGALPRPHDFSLEYTYLAGDLRRIAIVAGGLLLAMILGARLLQ
ncbi:MAG: hypothetical protein HYY05_08250 [Chloroflexi bacterium]|nr:hypothetical protein [Chloroflexota bacterium]